MNVDALRARVKIVGAIRRFFDGAGFLEVETAVRIPAPAPEEHIDCPPVEGGGYLRASPELQMKKLLAAGLDRIYQIGPCFREGERGSRHSPEFTMIEWYRKEADYLDIRKDLEDLLRRLFANVRGCEVDFATLKVREAYVRFAGWDPWLGEWNQDKFDFDMATKIEPAIREMGGGVFLTDYPPQAASLARLSASADDNGCFQVAERWEFYFDGLELANCFTELCDASEQRERFVRAKAARRELGESDYPLDEAFLECLSQIGSAAGVALGVDRLVMTLLQMKEISAVRSEM